MKKSVRMMITLYCGLLAVQSRAGDLEKNFSAPPSDDRLAVFWTWSNATDKPAITRDLEEMAHAGIGRAVLSMTLAHSATLTNGTGMVFLSPKFLETFRFALDEAARAGISITAVAGNGWYQGGPWVTPEMGAQMLVWSEKEVRGPAQVSEKLPLPDKYRASSRARIARTATDYLKPVATLAFRKDAGGKLVAGSMVDLSGDMKADGRLNWNAPDGSWVVYRFGHVPTMVMMKQDSPGYGGIQIDHLSRAAMERFLQEVAVPMLEAAGPHVGKTLDRLHEDSIELGSYDWTTDMPAQFQKRRGYDVIPLLPLLAGVSFTSGPESERVINDFEKTIEELLIDEHFGPFREFCHRYGMKLIAESGETRSGIVTKGAPVDCVMDEFWTHRTKETDFPVCFNRNAVFAAHVYGQNRNTCEAFTSHQQWMETPAQLKTLVNEVYAMGLNHLTIHSFSSSPVTTPPPGDVYFAGTHYNPGVTWWKDFAPSLTAFFNRCDTMLAAGLPATDLLYLDGPALQEMSKSNEMLREKDQRFWKFDGIPDQLMTRLSVDKSGRIALPSGQTYAVLVLADEKISLPAMQAAAKLVEQGATVWFQAVPKHALFFADGANADSEVLALVKRLGGDNKPGVYSVGKGRVLTGANRSDADRFGDGRSARTFYSGMHAEAMDRLGIAPAFSYRAENPADRLFFFERNADGAEVYFVANVFRTNVQAECSFRVAGKQPERWNPVTGAMEPISRFECKDGRTVIPLEFAANESYFIVFRKAGTAAKAGTKNPVVSQPVQVNGPWKISFVPARQNLESFDMQSDNLFRWDLSEDKRIKSFSGKATYQTQIEVPAEWAQTGRRITLDLGSSPGLYELTGAGGGGYDIRNDVYDTLCAEVVINGKSAGVLWCAPYRIDITGLTKTGTNKVEIRVTNTWHNWRLAAQFTAGKHAWEKKGLSLPSAPSGLLGPVTLSAIDKN